MGLGGLLTTGATLGIGAGGERGRQRREHGVHPSRRSPGRPGGAVHRPLYARRMSRDAVSLRGRAVTAT
jgi:hypothetical protein